MVDSTPTPAAVMADRDLGLALRRGVMGRCPACGKARLFQGYLTVRDHCPACGTELHHQRADDGPAYLTILIVSHLSAPLLLAIYMIYRPSTAVLLSTFLGGAVVLSLILLPVIKGAWVAMQWAKRMHGFGDGAEDRPAAGDPVA